MLYFGMLFSMFCWHVEGNYMYSVSYLHEGAPKTWYVRVRLRLRLRLRDRVRLRLGLRVRVNPPSVPCTRYGVSPANAAEFDRVFKTRGFPDQVAADPQLLLKKSSMLPPSLLLEEGVPVSRVVQRPGQFVVTLPQACRAAEPEP